MRGLHRPAVARPTARALPTTGRGAIAPARLPSRPTATPQPSVVRRATPAPSAGARIAAAAAARANEESRQDAEDLSNTPDYLLGVDGLPDDMAQLFAAADDVALMPAEEAAMADAISAACRRVTDARTRHEAGIRLRGRRALKGTGNQWAPHVPGDPGSNTEN